MKMKEFTRLAQAVERCQWVVDSEAPEASLGDLTTDELELVRAAIRRVMTERRDNIIERLGVQIDEEV